MLTKVSCDAQRPRPLGPGRLPPCGRLLMTRWTGGKSAAVRRAETCAACPPSSSSPTDTREGSSTKDFPGGSDGKASVDADLEKVLSLKWRSPPWEACRW